MTINRFILLAYLTAMSLLSFERAVIFHLFCSSEDRWQTTLFLRGGWGLSVFYQNQSRTICQTPLDQTNKQINNLTSKLTWLLRSIRLKKNCIQIHTIQCILFKVTNMSNNNSDALHLTVNGLLVCLFIGLNSLIPFCLLFILICYVLCSSTPCVSLSTLTGISITRISSSC